MNKVLDASRWHLDDEGNSLNFSVKKISDNFCVLKSLLKI